MNERGEALVAYHEAGHALVALLAAARRSGAQVTIIPRGDRRARLHAAAADRGPLPDDPQRAARPDRVLLGGRVAEEMIFGDISTGAQNDLERATEIARQMVCRSA